MQSLKRINIVAMLVVLSLVSFNSCTVVKHSDSDKDESEEVSFYFESEDFDVEQYVRDNWDSRIYAEISQNANDLSMILDGIKKNKDETISKFGVRKSETDSYSFIIKGVSAVKKIDKSSSAGLLVLENGAKIQIGPVIKKSMVRDVLSFINFGDFANQMEYASISREINSYIKNNVVNNTESSYTIGSLIRFYGVFVLDDIENIIITPVSITESSGDK